MDSTQLLSVVEMTEDTWLNILLALDIDDFETVCSINKITSKICHSDSFGV